MQKLKDINLVIASGSEKIQTCLQEMFIKQGANIVLCGFLDLKFVDQLEHNVSADVILIDMDDSYEEDDEALDQLLEKIDLPILFHDNDFDEINDSKEGEYFSLPAIEKLAAKLAELAANREPLADKKPEPPLTENKCVENQEKDASVDLVNVWVLGASIGGPEAVKCFLARIPKELPVAFVLAQHLGDGFVSLLANQLDRISTFKVKEGSHGDTLRHGEVIVVPVDNRMSLDEKGQIKFIEDDWKGHYKPSIDCVIEDVTSSFKKQAGVIIFSGMGADGVLASQQFVEKYNGNIWAQSSDTCVISSMPDSVRKANLVSYSGSPEALALKVAVFYMGKDSYLT